MMPADEIPLDIRRRLRWLPHLPYHTALGRRSGCDYAIGSFFSLKATRVKACGPSREQGKVTSRSTSERMPSCSGSGGGYRISGLLDDHPAGGC